MLKTFGIYYRLTKPGIIRGNLMTALAAYLYGAHGVYSLSVFLSLAVGTSFIIGSACVFNNIIDRDIDGKMSRTKQRELVVRALSVKSAVIYATVLLLAGCVVLLKGTNLLTLLFGVIGHVSYVLFYTFAKRKTSLSTLIGTVPGATPPVAGYLAATHRLDIVAVFLFLVLVTWQMPHFLAVAIRRLGDYKSASLPVMPVVKGIVATKNQILGYIVAFILACLGLAQFGHLDAFYVVPMLAVGGYWFHTAYSNTDKRDDKEWAKDVFVFSLIVLLVWDIAIALNYYL
jgi:protoheme IX farnesyltransferase